jgi:hypothetical protein
MIKHGISRPLGSPTVQKLPIDVEMLKKLAHVYDLTDSCDVCFWAALLVGFFSMLRKSSLLLKFTNSLSEMGLCRYDLINMATESFVLEVRHSKTKQFGRRMHQIPFVSCVDSSI